MKHKFSHIRSDLSWRLNKDFDLEGRGALEKGLNRERDLIINRTFTVLDLEEEQPVVIRAEDRLVLSLALNIPCARFLIGRSFPI